MLRKPGILFALIVLLIFAVGTICCADESQGYIRMLQSKNINVRIQAAKMIEGVYLLDPAVYPAVEERLRSSLREITPAKEHLDEIGWLCKALASSGDEEYAVTLKKVAGSNTNKKIVMYARQALEAIPEFAARKVLLEKTAGNPNLSFVDDRLLRMLKSGDLALQRNAAKRVYRSIEVAPEVYQAAAEALAVHAQNEGRERLQLDTMGWLCKALGASADLQYLGVLNKTYVNAPTDKLRQHARDAMDFLGGI